MFRALFPLRLYSPSSSPRAPTRGGQRDTERRARPGRQMSTQLIFWFMHKLLLSPPLPSALPDTSVFGGQWDLGNMVPWPPPHSSSYAPLGMEQHRIPCMPNLLAWRKLRLLANPRPGGLPVRSIVHAAGRCPNSNQLAAASKSVLNERHGKV